MSLNPLLKWALRQTLGKARFEMLLEFIEGPLGILIDSLTKGKIGGTVDDLNRAVDQLQEVAGRYGIRIVPPVK